MKGPKRPTIPMQVALVGSPRARRAREGLAGVKREESTPLGITVIFSGGKPSWRSSACMGRETVWMEREER